MNSNDFSNAHKISIRTLRFYQHLNLIQPIKANGVFLYDKRCENDIKLIKRLKLCGFTLAEITEWMKYVRSRDIDEKEKKKYYLSQINKKEVLANLNQSLLNDKIKKLDDLINGSKDSKLHLISGSSLDMIPLLCCPDCGQNFEYKNISIINNMIFEGNASCKCGYSLLIKEGIIIAQLNSSLSKLQPLTNNGETSKLNDNEVSLIHKNFNWITNKLKLIDIKEKVIFENSINVISYLNTGIKLMNTGAKYIIADSDYQVIIEIKNRIEALDLTLSILYIVCPSLNYPIRTGSIDILLDYYSSEIFQKYNIPTLANGIKKLLKKNSYIIGVFSYLKKGNKTLKNNRSLYPDSYWGRYQLIPFIDNLNKCSIKILDEQNITSVETCDSIDSLEIGEILGDYCFFAKLDM